MPAPSITKDDLQKFNEVLICLRGESLARELQVGAGRREALSPWPLHLSAKAAAIKVRKGGFREVTGVGLSFNDDTRTTCTASLGYVGALTESFERCSHDHGAVNLGVVVLSQELRVGLV